jgi:outer membrane protein assembly factor BamB
LCYKNGEKEKMNFFKNKTILSAIAVLTILSFTISMISLPDIANAQTANDEKVTFPFVDVIPRTVGVNQYALINFGLLNFLQVDGDGFNVTLVITDPNGKETRIDRMTWSTGMVGYGFHPDIIGEYTLQCVYDGEYYDAASTTYRGWYAASKSDKLTLVVQEQPVKTYPDGSLPDAYWTRPIDSQLREWWTIAGSWSHKPNNLFAPYNAAPESAHILWTMPIGDTMGGLSGGENWQVGYQNGDAYEGKFAGSIIISGILYYNRYVSGSPTQTIVAVDLHTGKTLWERSYDFGGSRISTGQILTWLCLNNRGTWAYVWMTSGTNMYALDALTGDLKYNMTNVPSGTIYYGLNGEMLKYQIVNYGTTEAPNYHLLQWNSSYVVTKDKIGMQESWGSQVQGQTYNATERGYDLNVSLAINEPLRGSIIQVFPEDRIIVGQVTTGTGASITLSAISLESGKEGRVLFANEQYVGPAEWEYLTLTSIGQAGWGAFSQENYVAIYWTKENRVNYAFSLENGKYLWETPSQVYADAWSDTTTASFGPERLIAYNKLFVASVGGIVYCYDINDGSILWTYEATDPYGESYISPNWWLVPLFISEHKLYLGHMEHSAMEPKPRGAPFFALDTETGDLVWEIDGAFRQTRWGGRAIIGDGVIATMDTYDQQIYAIGKGPSSMTLSTPELSVAANTQVLLKGTIMDVSPGTQDDKVQLRFPNGVPAVSDASMSDFMLYVYKQFQQPMDTTGLTIYVDAITPKGEYVQLGTTTSDANGRFTYSFTPTMEGKYTIYASFAGSASYYRSDAQNELLVSAASSSSDANNGTDYGLYTLVVAIIILVAVVLFGLLATVLRKK